MYCGNPLKGGRKKIFMQLAIISMVHEAVVDKLVAASFVCDQIVLS